MVTPDVKDTLMVMPFVSSTLIGKPDVVGTPDAMRHPYRDT